MQPFWSAAFLQPQRHRLALHCLAERGYTTYAPLIAGAPIWRGRVGEPRSELLFGNYAFILIVEQWSLAACCPGVRRLVTVGSGFVPARVPDRIITELRAREGADGLIQLPRKPPPPGLRRGEKVRVIRGAFEGLDALYQGMAPHERVRVLLTILGAIRTIELPSDDVERPQRRARRR